MRENTSQNNSKYGHVLRSVIELNTRNLPSSFHAQNFLKDNIFSVLKSGVKLLLIDSKNALIDITIFSNPASHRKDDTPNIRRRRCKDVYNFKCNLVSHFNKLRDTAAVLGSKDKGLELPFK